MGNISGPRCHPHGITGYGDPSKGVMFVGIHPGPQEMKDGRPDTGQAGQLMDQCVASADWDPAHTYHTNLFCYDTQDDSKENIALCLPRLQDEIEAYQPKLVVFFGALVAQQFGIRKRGYIYPKMYPHPHWEMYCYHPASVLHGNNDAVYDIMRDLAKIPRVMNDMDVPPLRRPRYHVVHTQTEAQYVLDHRISPDALIALDIETRLHNPNEDELDIHGDSMRCLAVCDGENIYVFPRDTLDNLRWPANLRTIYHNGQFDTQGLRKYLGVDLPIYEDTCLESYAGDEYSGTMGSRKGQNKLETLVGEYFGDHDYKEATKKMWRKHIEPDNQSLYERNAYDAWYTYHLHPVLQQLRPPFPAYSSLLVPAANMFSEIIERGAYISVDAQRELRSEWGPQYLELKLDIQEHVKNMKSWKQLSDYIYGDISAGGLGLPGGPSTAAKILREIDHPFVKSVLEVRQLKYRMENWVVGLKKFIKADSRVHAEVLLHGPETGRRAYHKPPLQTIAKHGEQQARIRSLFAATNDDYVIVEADYSQIEVWVGAYLSGDTALLHDLQSGDVHTATTLKVGLDPKDNKEYRQVGKTTNFLMQYGGGGVKLHNTLLDRGIFLPLAQCHNIITAWREAYGQYAEYTDRIWREIQEVGFITTPFGRMRRCPLVTDWSWRATFINWPIQSTAGDYILTSFLKLHKLLREYDSYILFDVHDSGVFEVNKKYLPEVLALIKQVMEEPKADGQLPGVAIEMTMGPDLYTQHKVDFKQLVTA